MPKPNLAHGPPADRGLMGWISIKLLTTVSTFVGP